MHFISKNIKALRLERGWTQQEMADLLFVTRQTVSNWENGKALPDVETLLQIAEKLNIDVNELVYGKRKADEMLKRDVLHTLKRLAILFVFFYTVSVIHRKVHASSFLFSGMIFMYTTLRPLILFFSGMLLIQIFKYTGVIKNSNGVTNIRFIKYIFVFIFIVCFLSYADVYISEITIIVQSVLRNKFNLNIDYSSFSVQYPVWTEKIRGFIFTLCMGEKAYNPPYELSFGFMGMLYELAKPYKAESTNNEEFDKIKTSLKDITNHPDIHLKKFIGNCKETFEFITSKSLFVRNAALILIVLYLLKILTFRFTTFFRKWVYTGITLPLTIFTTGTIVAILFKRIVTVYKTDGFRLRKVISVFSLILLAVSFMVFIPEMAREIVVLLDRVGIITVTGTYDITGWVLTPPLWFDRLNEFFTKVNTSSKIWWWAVLGFVNEAAKPYHGKEKYSTEKA